MAKRLYDKDYNDKKKELVKSHLNENCVGVENAIRYKDSKELFGLHSRQLAFIITDLRNEGYPVCASNADGIWWAKNREEILVSMKIINSRINAMTACVKGLNKSLNNFA